VSFDFNVSYSSCWGYSLINTFKLKKKTESSHGRGQALLQGQIGAGASASSDAHEENWGTLCDCSQRSDLITPCVSSQVCVVWRHIHKAHRKQTPALSHLALPIFFSLSFARAHSPGPSSVSLLSFVLSHASTTKSAESASIWQAGAATAHSHKGRRTQWFTCTQQHSETSSRKNCCMFSLCICLSRCMGMHFCVCVCAFAHVHTSLYICTYMCVYSNMFIYMLLRARVCVCVYVCVCACVPVHIYTHMHTHIKLKESCPLFYLSVFWYWFLRQWQAYSCHWVTYMNESCYAYACIMLHMNESCHTYECVVSHIGMSHVTCMN